MTTLTTDQFMTIGNTMFGECRWGSKMASATGVSQPSISNAIRGVAISKKTSAAVLNAFESYKCNAIAVATVSPTTVMTPTAVAMAVSAVIDNRTDEEILSTIRVRFDVTDRAIQGVINGYINSVMVFGAAGVGKSFNILGALEHAKNTRGLYVDVIKVTCTAPGLYVALYNARNGGVVALDDCDSVFDDEETLNLLKAALDSSDTRTISWRKASRWVYDAASGDEVSDDDDRLPNQFEFNGSVVFITNKNIKQIASANTKQAPHMSALVSRSHYIDLCLSTERECMLRITDVFMNCGMYQTLNLSEQSATEILSFVRDNKERMNELSLRALKIMADTFVSETAMGHDWKEMAMVTQMT